jgi:hypothetical protein
MNERIRQDRQGHAGPDSQENESQAKGEAIEGPSLDTEDRDSHKPNRHTKKEPPAQSGFLRKFIKKTKLTNCAMTIATVVIAVATVVYAIYAGKQWHVMTDQLGYMQKQLEITDRPWVGVDVAIKDKIMFSEWVTERNVNRQISVPLSFSLKNYGASPARNITIIARLLPYPGNAHARELDGPEDKLCAESRKQAKEQPIRGITIFPDDTKIEESGTGYYVLNANEKILYSVLGCVDYTYADGQHGRTAFRMLLGGPFEHGQWSGLPYKLGNDDALTKKWKEPPPRVGTINVGTADTFEFSPDPNGGNYAE